MEAAFSQRSKLEGQKIKTQNWQHSNPGLQVADSACSTYGQFTQLFNVLLGHFRAEKWQKNW
jgi:hypothetical protein